MISQNAYSLHRLVAKIFIPNPDNKETVNHKDGNKLNSKASNLEWMTNSENINTPTTRIKPNTKKITQYSLSMERLKNSIHKRGF
jgi:hypothetical protein